MEELQPMGRHLAVDAGIVHISDVQEMVHRVALHDQAPSAGTGHGKWMDSFGGNTGVRVIADAPSPFTASTGVPEPTVTATVADEHSTDRQVVQDTAGSATSQIDRSFIQERSVWRSSSSSSKQQSGPAQSSFSSKTQGQVERLSSNESAVRTEQSGTGTGAWNSVSDSMALIQQIISEEEKEIENENESEKENEKRKEQNHDAYSAVLTYMQHEDSFFVKGIDSTELATTNIQWSEQNGVGSENRHTINGKKGNSKFGDNVPTPLDLETLEVHPADDASSRCNDLAIIGTVMEDRAVERANYIRESMYTVGSDFKCSTRLPRSGLLEKHAKILCDRGVIRVVSSEELKVRPTRCGAIPFMIKEERKKDGERKFRLRWILWTKALNAYIKARGYKANVDLLHSSKYHGALDYDLVSDVDLKAAYYQFEVPESARDLYRFQDMSGNVYECVCLSMGISPAVEYAQLITSALIGKHHVARPLFRHDPNLRVDVFVDGARTVALKKDLDILKSHNENLLQKADEFNVKLKDSVIIISTQNEFIGGDWHFTDKTISVTEKNREKILSMKLTKQNEELDPFELEKLVGRLLHATGLLQINLCKYYWVLKWMAKLMNKLNRGINARVRLPPSVFYSLFDWQQECVQTHKIICRAKTNVSGTVFSDASTTGWGAVFISEENRLFIVGGKWMNTAFTNCDIAYLEAEAARRAVMCLQKFIANSHFNLFIDNSSIVYAIGKGYSRNLSINSCLGSLYEVCDRLDSTVSVKWISTKENIADPISRM